MLQAGSDPTVWQQEDTEIVVYSGNGMSVRNKREVMNPTGVMLNERSQTQKQCNLCASVSSKFKNRRKSIYPLELRAVLAPSGEGNSSEKDNFLKWARLHTVIWQMKTTYILGLCIIPEFRFQILF